MPVVTNTIKRPDGTAYTAGRVVIELAGTNGRPLSGGYVTAGNYTIESAYTIETLTAGVWSQSLVANSLINPAGTVWRVTEQVDGRSHVYYVTVPDGAGPYFVEDILDDVPGTIESSALRSHADNEAAHGTRLLAYEMQTPLSWNPNDVYARSDMANTVRGQNGSRLYGRITASDTWGYSDDHGATWTNTGAVMFTEHGAGELVELWFDDTYMYAVQVNGKLWRNVIGDFTGWTDVSVAARPAGTTARVGIVANTATALFYGNYNASSGEGARVWRSTDNGTTWTETLTVAAARHVHAVKADPWEEGRVWATVGDETANGAGLYRSDDDGVTWRRVSSNRYGIDIDFFRATGYPDRVILEGDGSREAHLFQYVIDQDDDDESGITEPLIWPDTTPADAGASWAGSARGLRVTSDGNVFYWTTGESGAIGTRYGLWLSKGPLFPNAVLLEEYSFSALKTYESGGYILNRALRSPLPKFAGDTANA